MDDEQGFEAWEVLLKNNKPNLRKDVDVLSSLSNLMASNKLKNTNWDGFITNSTSLKKHLQYLDKLKDKQGINSVVADIAAGGNNGQGAEFVLDYAGSNSQTWIDDVKAFEKYDNDFAADGARRYDILKGVKPDEILMELKHWWGAWNTTSFRTQFIKDLSNMEGLGKIQWKFKKTTTVAPDIATLKGQVLNSLGTFDKTTNKWVAGTDLKSLYTSNESTLKATFGDDVLSADDVLNKLSLDSKFEAIFEIID